MSAHESNTSRYRLNEAREFWHERWTLESRYASCLGCPAQQLAEDVRESFMHVDGCAMATDFAKHP